MNEALRIESLTGPAIRPYLDAVARLRIAVFRDFPYLYDGSLDYETDYLAAYSACAESLFVLRLRGERDRGRVDGHAARRRNRRAPAAVSGPWSGG